MREIEIKARVKDSRSVLAALDKLECVLSEPVHQRDTVYAKAGTEDKFSEFQPGAIFLRLREAKGKVMFTLKQPQSNDLDCVENESEVSDRAEMDQSLKLMGFVPVVNVEKNRRTTKCGDYEICFDEVAGLGTFIEVETILPGDIADGEMIQGQLWKFLERLGVSKDDEVTRGYDVLVYNASHGQS